MTVRAYVTLADLTRGETREVRDRVRAWAEARGLEATTRHVAVPNAETDDGERVPLRRFAHITAIDPTPGDLIALADLIAPWAWPERPTLNITRDAPGGMTA